jgi:uncharacterized coiled-coil protein SlyX
MADETVVLLDVPIVKPAAPPASPCGGGCAAALADLQSAIAQQTDLIEGIVSAVNSIGEITTHHQAKLQEIVNAVGQFQAKFANLSPGQMLKSLMGASRGRPE